MKKVIVPLADGFEEIEAIGMSGSMNLNRHDGQKEVLKEMKKQDKYIAAICAAPLVLGTLGMLEGLHATCYP